MKLHWTRNKYHGRGILREQDVIAEFQIAGKCAICGKTKERKRYRSGMLEQMSSFVKRKTCGKYVDKDGELQFTSCLRVIPQGKRWEPGCEGWLAGKTFEEAFGKDVAIEMKQKLSDEMKHKLATGKIDTTKPKQEFVCEVCGKKLLLTPYWFSVRKVCSLSCAGKLSIGSTGKHWTLRNRRKFLGIQHARRKGEYKVCIQCKDEFYLHPSVVEKHSGKFCSRDCEVESHRLTKPCQKCNQPFTVRKSESWKIKNCVLCRK